MTKVGFISLGCCKNLVDTEVMLYNLHAAGFEITPNEEGQRPDVAISRYELTKHLQRK